MTETQVRNYVNAEGFMIKVYPEPLTVKLAGNSKWLKDEAGNLRDKEPLERIQVYAVYRAIQYDSRQGSTFRVYVAHSGPWWIYTDTGFEETMSQELGRPVIFTEQGGQYNGLANIVFEDEGGW